MWDEGDDKGIFKSSGQTLSAQEQEPSVTSDASLDCLSTLLQHFSITEKQSTDTVETAEQSLSISCDDRFTNILIAGKESLTVGTVPAQHVEPLATSPVPILSQEDLSDVLKPHITILGKLFIQ